MTDSWTDRLSEYVDDELDADTQRAIEAHLTTCADCRAIVDELRQVVARARRVGYNEPTTDLWRSIEASIAVAKPTPKHRRLVTMSLGRLAAAAAIVALVAGGFAWTIASRRSTPITVTQTGAPVVPDVRVATSGTSALAIASYRDAAADLERALQAGRGTLKPETMRVIEENLRAMDVAIAQADSALQRDPGSAYLNQYLAATMQRKLKLLRRAVEITTARS